MSLTQRPAQRWIQRRGCSAACGVALSSGRTWRGKMRKAGSEKALKDGRRNKRNKASKYLRASRAILVILANLLNERQAECVPHSFSFAHI